MEVEDYFRVHDRFKRSSKVFFLDTVTSTIDISMGGFLMECEHEFFLGDKLSFGLEIGDSDFIQVFGEIVRCDRIGDKKFISGIKFTDLCDDTYTQLERFLNI